MAAVPEADLPASLGPMIPRQAELAELTGVIANALEEQSRTEPSSEGPAAGVPGGEDQAVKLRRAAELTLEAQIEMERGGEKLAAPAPDLEAARAHQDFALERLVEAIQELTPPQEQGDQEQEEQDQEQGQEEGQQPQAGEQPQPEEGPEADPSQLLQEVRDREAERRRENAERQNQGFDTVERDW